MIDLRLTKIQRLRARCGVALLYLLCVMTPTIALALPGTTIPDCLLLDAAAVVHVHNHGAGDAHHHATSGGRAGTHDHGTALNTGHPLDQPPQRGHHTSTGGSCCELMCLTALPAMSTDITPPIPVVSLCVNEASRVIVGSAPPRHYRPPIFLS
jgi:hypothetical protein